MLEAFLNFIQRNNLFEPGEKVLLAVSGGIDSMVMSHLFYSASCNFAMAHCNFCLRGTESDRDEELVCQLATKYEVPFFNVRFNTIHFASENKLTIQVAARNLRIEWLEEIVHSGGFTCFATAHHQDDSIETFFLNLIRGTGIKGLRGIQPKNGLLIHPMLFSTRKQIECYAREQGIIFREDSSNRQNYYRRNQLRNTVIPELVKIQPDFGKIMTSNIKRLESVWLVYNEKLNEIKKEYIRKEGRKTFISFNRFFNLELADVYLSAILDEYGFTADTSKKIFLSYKKPNGRKFYTENFLLTVGRDHLIISEKPKNKKEGKSYLVHEEIIENDLPINLSFSTIERDEIKSLKTKLDEAMFDKELLRFPLVLRRWKRGDYFYPFGLGGRKKLSDYFIDQKFLDEQKQQTWLLCSGNDIIWIVGYRTDDRYKITGKTKQVLFVNNCETDAEKLY